MPTAIITLVGKSMEKVGEIPIGTSDFDSGIETHHMIAKRAVEDILRKMYLIQKDEKLKYEFSFSTVVSQAEYSLGFNASQLASTDLRVILSDNTDYWLTYLDETTALDKYIDFDNLTDEGKPSEWWFRTGSTADTIKLRLNLVPDDIYTIKGFKYVPYSAVTALSITPFTDLGDSVIVDYVAAMLANKRYDETNTQQFVNQFERSWSSWLLEDQNTNNLTIVSLPYQAPNEHNH